MQHTIEVLVADITTLSVDVIVTAAEATLAHVAPDVLRAAGPRLPAHLATLGACPVGASCRTPAFDLEARGVRWIVHAVVPRWGTDPYADGSEKLGHRLEDIQLAQLYQQALELTAEVGGRSLAIPVLGAGAPGYPLEREVQLAVGHARFHADRRGLPERIVLVCASEAQAAPYRRMLVPRDFTAPIQIGRRQ